MSISLTGAISGTFTSFPTCGSSGPLLSWSDLEGPSHLGVAFGFMGLAPPVDQLGTFPLQSLDITQLTDGPALHWGVPPGTCSVTIQGSICSPTAVFMHRRVLSGTGTCSQPATAELGNTAPPITVGNFTFVGFIDPM
jgi:hypothetical protein